MLVTGGGSGIGAAICHAITEQGACVAVAEIDADRGERVATDLGDSALFFRTDVTDLSSVQQAVRAAVARSTIAPGADEFIPPSGGVWLPPERTFSSVSRRFSPAEYTPKRR